MLMEIMVAMTSRVELCIERSCEKARSVVVKVGINCVPTFTIYTAYKLIPSSAIRFDDHPPEDMTRFVSPTTN